MGACRSMELAKHYDVITLRDLIDEAFAQPVDTHKRLIPTRRSIGDELFFKRFDPEIVVNTFVAVVEYFPIYAAEKPALSEWSVRGCSNLLHLIIQSFITALTPFESNNGTRKSEKVNGKPQKQKVKSAEPPLVLNDNQRAIILCTILPFDFAVETKFWNLVCYALNLKACPQLFVTAVINAIKRNNASFASLVCCLHEPLFSCWFKDPSIIGVAMLLGPLRATTVEAFACNRSKEFRQKCREVILEMEKCTASKSSWRRQIDTLLSKGSGRVRPIDYPAFCESVKALMKDLKGEPPADDRIHVGWAHAVIKKCGAKCYQERTWKPENFHEVIWTILAQRPFMKKFVVETLTKDFNDPVEAGKWKLFNKTGYSRTKIQYDGDTEMDPLSSNPPFVSFPRHVNSIEFVRHPSHLRRVENLLEDCSLSDFPIVGLDAEWSSYVSHSKATILQLAMRTKVFIIDIDSIPQQALIGFFEKLFAGDNILKIGYRFGEDLVQLRSAVPKCPILYHPKNLICIDSLVRSLLEESVKRPDVSLEGIVFPIANDESGGVSMGSSADETIVQEASGASLDLDPSGQTELNIIEEVSKTGEPAPCTSNGTVEMKPTSDKEKDVNSNEAKDEGNGLLAPIKGLSALCERILGSPLDKTEQCSVWDRRPLRSLQIRYAALDAYVMIMLYEKCVEWAARLDLRIEDICRRQHPLVVSLPLFCGD